jgi:hypothetical protein
LLLLNKELNPRSYNRTVDGVTKTLYVGMFLGYFIIQVPDLVNIAFGTAANSYGIVYKHMF